MALTIANTGKGAINLLKATPQLPKRPLNLSFLGRKTRTSVLVSAAKKVSSRIGKYDSKNRKSSVSTSTTWQDDEEVLSNASAAADGIGGMESTVVDDGYFLPELPGDKPDFFEGAQWDWLGFFGEYMWAFGIVFALIACGVAVATYNEGAADFKDTPAYKESSQTRELIEGPEESNADVFETNPTEVAPSLE